MKSYLHHRGLKDVFTGGLGSFSLTVMLVFYLEVSKACLVPGGQQGLFCTWESARPERASPERASPLTLQASQARWQSSLNQLSVPSLLWVPLCQPVCSCAAVHSCTRCRERLCPAEARWACLGCAPSPLPWTPPQWTRRPSPLGQTAAPSPPWARLRHAFLRALSPPPPPSPPLQGPPCPWRQQHEGQ